MTRRFLHLVFIIHLIAYAVLILNCQYSFSQSEYNWVKTFGDHGHQIAYSGVQAEDGGFVICGCSETYHSSDSYNYWIIKLSSSGSLVWSKYYGGSKADMPFSIQNSSNGGFIVTGFAFSLDGDVMGNHGGVLYGDYWVLKLDENGNKEWAKCFGGTNDDKAKSVQQTNDGGYIITGSSRSTDGDVTGNMGWEDYWTIKIDGNGNLEWEKSYGGSNIDVANSVSQTSDGGYVIAGYTFSNDFDVTGNHGNKDFWIVKTDNAGNMVWERTLGGSKEDVANCIMQTTDGGCIVAGSTRSNDGDVVNRHYDTIYYTDQNGFTNWQIFEEFWIVKLNSLGNIDWQKTFGGSYSDMANSIWQCSDGGYLVAGVSYSENGDVISPKELGSIWVIKINSEGEILKQNRFGGKSNADAYFIQQTTDNGCLIVGSLYEAMKNMDYYVARLDDQLTLNPEYGVFVYPNPSNEFIVIASNNIEYVELYSTNGEKILTTENYLLYLNNCQNGMYIIKVHDTEGNIYIKKIIRM